MTDAQPVDLLVVGGGINGCGIARDAAGRGLGVVLCEKGDLGSATSSASSKLIHGGLRYLEHWELRLVREALIEREVLLRAAPHIIWPLRFVLPHSKEQRPAWMIRLGLLLYDHLGGRKLLPKSEGLDLRSHPAGAPLEERYVRGFAYADCWVEDSRLVVLNARDAAERGATVLTRTACVRALREDGLWRARLEGPDGAHEVLARCLVNATGPWVSRFLAEAAGMPGVGRMRLVKGSHIVVPRMFDHGYPYILQNDDRRIVFVIPYERRFTLIGTTDLAYDGDPARVRITEEETGYLCRAVNRYFRHKIAPADVVWAYGGVRPLYDDSRSDVSAVTRDYVFDLDAGDGRAPLLSVFGGKITTYRKLAEHALARLRPVMRFEAGPWTAGAHLPGGDIPGADFEGFLRDSTRRWPFVPEAVLRRLARAYGTRIEHILGEASALDDLGVHLGGGLFEAELAYLVGEEWAQTTEDVLWRRSKLGLHLAEAERAEVAAWLGEDARTAAVSP
jgi:glycerol-3-phosphate dehydrogenase